MKESKSLIFSGLLRDLEADIGTRDMALLVFKSLKNSIYSFKAKSSEDFCKQFTELVEVISNTEPKFGVLNYNFAKLMKSFNQMISKKIYSEKKWKEIAISEIEEILKKNRGMKRKIIEFSDQIDVEGKTILIHDHSHTVQDVLCHFRSIKKHFKVIIAEQDYEKTHGVIERMHVAGIPFQVVPSYMLSHIHDRINMAFFGSVTLKDTMDFVMDPGTYGIISELKVDNIPSYMFVESNKFSYWKSKKRGEIFIHKQKRKHYAKPIEYERIKYSHDRVPVKLFYKVVSDKGVFTSPELKKFFSKKMKELSQGPDQDK